MLATWPRVIVQEISRVPAYSHLLITNVGNLRNRSRKGTTAASSTCVIQKDSQTTSIRLLTIDQIPPWQQAESPYILTGYRPQTPSVRQCFLSWGYLHNETISIYSHIIGALVFLGLLLGILDQARTYFHRAEPSELIVLAVYAIGVAVCYSLSVLYHTLVSHSRSVAEFGIQLDFQGIIVLIWSATSPLAYYTFITEQHLQILYISLISILAFAASVMTFTAAFRQAETKPLHAAVFGSLALSTLACPLHGLLKHGWQEQSARFPMWAIGGTALFNALGVAAYVLNFPERLCPRRYDIIGASHQLMHCAVVIASLMWFAGMVAAHNHVHSAAIDP